MRDRGVLEFVRGEQYHSVYIIGPARERDVSKIGIAADPVKRFNNIQASHWEELRIWAHWWLAGRPLAARVEAAIKKRLAPKNLSGEWFACLPRVMAEAVEQEAARMQIPLFPESVILAHVKEAEAAFMRDTKQWVDKTRAFDTK